MHALAAAMLREPGREGGHQAASTSWLQPVCASRGGGEATWQQGRAGCSQSALAGVGGSADKRHARPGCGRYALVGAGGWTPGSEHAPAMTFARARAGEKLPGTKDAPAIAGLRYPGLEGARTGTYMPWLWPFCGSRGWTSSQPAT